MTDTAFQKIRTSTRFKETCADSGIGENFIQWAAIDADVSPTADEGWDDLGVIMGDIDYGPQIAKYLAAGGVPETDLCGTKTEIKIAFSQQLEYPEVKAIALAHGQDNPTVTYVSPANDTTVDTGTQAPTSTTINVNAGDGANYSAGMKIEIVVGSATYGTTSKFRYIESVSGDVITIDRPITQLPENGAALKEYDYLKYSRSTGEFPARIQIRFIENHNGRSGFDIVHFPKVLFEDSAYVPGGKDTPTNLTLAMTALGNYNSTDDRYDLVDRYSF